MSVCSKCGHSNAAGKDFCSECGEFLGWAEDTLPPLPPPATVAAVGPSRVVAEAADPAVRQAEDDARAAEEEARRVRAEAELRAREATQTAKRRATEEARGARAAAYGRAEQVVELASRTFTGSQAEVAALVAQVRQEAESKARVEVDDAELRAARRARRAREEAHARARAESAEAEQKAADAAQRASALIARTPATVDPGRQPTQPNPVTTTQPMPTAGGPARQNADGARAIAPVLPGPIQWQPPPAEATEEAIPANPGDISCRRCGVGNDPSRRFCRKCGESLVFVPGPPRLSWSERLRTWLAFNLNRLRRRPGEPQPEVPAPGSSGPGLSMAGVTRGTLALIAVVALVAAIGPYRGKATAEITSLRRRVIPKPSYIEGEVASSGADQTVIPTLTDKSLDADPFMSSTINATNVPGPANPPVFSVRLGKDGDLTKPVNLFKVGIVAGALGEQPPKHPSVHHLYLVAIGNTGHQEKTKALTLRDDTSFQSFLFAVNHVVRVDFYVLDTYTSPNRTGPYTIDQVEFFALT